MDELVDYTQHAGSNLTTVILYILTLISLQNIYKFTFYFNNNSSATIW